MKKFLLIFLSSFVICSAETTPLKKPFTGFFVGGGLGGSLLGGEHAYEAGGDSGNLVMRGFGFLMNAVGGYMYLTDAKTWFAGELYFNLKSAKSKKEMKNVLAQGEIEIKSKNTFGLSASIGGPLNPRVMMYAKAGFEMGSFSFKYTNLTTTCLLYTSDAADD